MSSNLVTYSSGEEEEDEYGGGEIRRMEKEKAKRGTKQGDVNYEEVSMDVSDEEEEEPQGKKKGGEGDLFSSKEDYAAYQAQFGQRGGDRERGQQSSSSEYGGGRGERERGGRQEHRRDHHHRPRHHRERDRRGEERDQQGGDEVIINSLYLMVCLFLFFRAIRERAEGEEATAAGPARPGIGRGGTDPGLPGGEGEGEGDRSSTGCLPGTKEAEGITTTTRMAADTVEVETDTRGTEAADRRRTWRGETEGISNPGEEGEGEEGWAAGPQWPWEGTVGVEATVVGTRRGRRGSSSTWG